MHRRSRGPGSTVLHRVVHVPVKRKAIIFDIDGTLAIRATGPDGRGPYDWDRVGEDTVNESVMTIANMLGFAAGATDDYEVLFFSGRDERCTFQTNLWLRHHYSYDYLLRMRPEKDNRPDYEVKREMLEWATEFYDIVAVFDDRNQVVDMWRDNGITCMQVCSREQGDF